MRARALNCKNTLIKYMEQYLDGKINRVEYYEYSEEMYSMYGDLLKIYYSTFNEVFINRVPDACLCYIDEPGLDEVSKEQLFRKEILETYNILINL